jgi:hypothetical protein
MVRVGFITATGMLIKIMDQITCCSLCKEEKPGGWSCRYVRFGTRLDGSYTI